MSLRTHFSAQTCLSLKPNGALFAVLAVEGHSHAVVPQALRTGSPELPAFVSTLLGRVSMLAFVCSDVQTSLPVTLSPLNFPSVCFCLFDIFPDEPGDPRTRCQSAGLFTHTPFCPPCRLVSCSYRCLLIQCWAGSGA